MNIMQKCISISFTERVTFVEFINTIIKKYNEISLILRILCGLVIGTLLGLSVSGLGAVTFMGTLFVKALKAIAPLLVMCLVTSSIAKGKKGIDSRFSLVISLYLISTFLASVAAVISSFLFPQTIKLTGAAKAESVPQGLGEVISNGSDSFICRNLRSLWCFRSGWRLASLNPDGLLAIRSTRGCGNAGRSSRLHSGSSSRFRGDSAKFFRRRDVCSDSGICPLEKDRKILADFPRRNHSGGDLRTCR